MRIFYFCYGSAHSSITAANLHLGVMPLGRRARVSEIIHQPMFDRAENYQIGQAILMGTDEQANEIYALGLAGSQHPMAHALRDFLELNGVDTGQVLFADALQNAGLSMRIGGFSSRRLGLIFPGRQICAFGVWQKYPKFVALVRRIRTGLGLPSP